MAFISGFCLGLTLILGIGAQNIFILKQAINKHYALSTAMICFLCDITLIILSIFLTTKMTQYMPILRPIMLLLAILFLIYYGAFSLKSSLLKQNSYALSFQPKEIQTGFIKILILGLSFSLLNPQALLDIIVLLGGVASKYSNTILKIEFMTGASLASVTWFSSLALSGLFLRKFIKKAIVWRWLEGLTGILMFIIAIRCSLLLFS